jgi:hypothetical protein
MSVTKRILDEETKKQLLGFYPFGSDQTIEFTPDQLPVIKSEYKVSFTVRALRQEEKHQLEVNGGSIKETSTTDEVVCIIDKNKEVFRGCVLGCKNLFDLGSGEEIQYKSAPSGGMDKDIWKSLPDTAMKDQIIRFIRKISGLLSIEMLGLK